MEKIIKINCYIETKDVPLEELTSRGNLIIDAYQRKNLKMYDNVTTKLYYIIPKLNIIRIIIPIDEINHLGVVSNILLDTTISNFNLERLPAQLISYKELMIKNDSELSETQILETAYKMIEKEMDFVFPTKVPILKIINYRNNKEPVLILPNIFSNVFKSSGRLMSKKNNDSIIIKSRKETVQVNYKEILPFDGLELIGRGTLNWNESYQRNFMKLSDRLEYLENLYNERNL